MERRYQLDTEENRIFLAEIRQNLLDFGRRFPSPGGGSYYLGDDGNMLTGWQEIGGIWYYFGEDGSMYTGWLESAPGEWYYLNADGSMASDVTIDGRRLNASGVYRE